MSKLSPSNNINNLVIIGHMGSGKSTIGLYLAKKLSYRRISSKKLNKFKCFSKKTIKAI